MAKKKTGNDLYRESQYKTLLTKEYEKFLKEKELLPSPHSADLFSIQVDQGLLTGSGMNKRQLIIFLADELPYMYD